MIRILPDVENEKKLILFDGDQPCGSAEWMQDGDKLRILSVEAPDELLAEGMVRAVLNAGRVREIVTAVCGKEELYPILQKLEFQETENGMEVDIADFFFRGCCCK